jgi:sortase (surface protein transpeptidase)
VPLVAAVWLAIGVPGQQEPPASPAATQRAEVLTAVDSSPAPSEAPVVERSAPVAISIPAIDLATSLSRLGLNADGTVQVPNDPAKAGWFRLGPSPGQLGSSVILGHVDSYQGPAVFYRLRFLQAGDRVAVTLADGVVARFVVTKVAMYQKERFPARRVYASHGGSALQLVTCGGRFDTVTRSYQSNVVVYTSLVSTQPAAARDAVG